MILTGEEGEVLIIEAAEKGITITKDNSDGGIAITDDNPDDGAVVIEVGEEASATAKKKGVSNKYLEEEKLLNQLSTSYEEKKEAKAPLVKFKAGAAIKGEQKSIERAIFTTGTFTDVNGNKYIVPEDLMKKMNRYYFKAFCIASQKALYEQSVLSEKYDKESGDLKGLWSEKDDMPLVVKCVLNDYCRDGIGISDPDNIRRREMMDVIDLLHQYPITKISPDGRQTSINFCQKWMPVKTKDGSPTTCYLFYYRKFGQEVINRFLIYPSDVAKKLWDATRGGRLRPIYFDLMDLLTSQRVDRKKPFVRTMKQLVIDLDLEKAYNRSASDTDKDIIKACEVMVAIGRITKYVTYKMRLPGRKGDCVTKIAFYINKEWENSITTTK